MFQNAKNTLKRYSRLLTDFAEIPRNIQNEKSPSINITKYFKIKEFWYFTVCLSQAFQGPERISGLSLKCSRTGSVMKWHESTKDFPIGIINVPILSRIEYIFQQFASNNLTLLYLRSEHDWFRNLPWIKQTKKFGKNGPRRIKKGSNKTSVLKSQSFKCIGPMIDIPVLMDRGSRSENLQLQWSPTTSFSIHVSFYWTLVK